MILNDILNASDSHTKYILPKQTNHAPSRHRPYRGTTVNAVLIPAITAVSVIKSDPITAVRERYYRRNTVIPILMQLSILYNI